VLKLSRISYSERKIRASGRKKFFKTGHIQFFQGFWLALFLIIGSPLDEVVKQFFWLLEWNFFHHCDKTLSFRNSVTSIPF